MTTYANDTELMTSLSHLSLAPTISNLLTSYVEEETVLSYL